MTARRRRLVIAVALVVAGLAAVALRVVREGRAALADGDAALADHRPADALAAWETAARWYLPGAPHVDEAYDRLTGYARAHDSLAAWRAIRRAARATRTLWTPHAGELAQADAAIARLAAADPEGSPLIADPGRRLGWHTGRLEADRRPSRGALALAVLGIVAWLAGAIVVVRGRLRIGAAVAVLGLVAWAAGLYSA